MAGVTSEQVNLRDGLWVFEAHKTVNKTGKPREVLLAPAMVTLTERLMAEVPPGTPLFRDSKGEPWNQNSVRCRFRRVRTFLKLGSDVVGNGPAIDKQLLADELGRSANQGDWEGAAEIIARMCAPERVDRYATVADVMEDLSICEL